VVAGLPLVSMNKRGYLRKLKPVCRGKIKEDKRVGTIMGKRTY